MTRSPARSRSQSTRFGVERLEARENPAGNVLAALSGGVLAVQGDAADNQFSVQKDGYGDYFVYGMGGTTINGQPYIHLGRTPLAGVQVTAGAGNDWVEFVNIHTAGEISVRAGQEADAAVFYGVSAGGMNLSMDGGDDTFVTDNVWVNGAANLDGGAGIDTIDFRRYGIAAVQPNLTNTERQVGGVLANDLMAGVVNDVLLIRGDAADNRFSIQRDKNGDYFVYGVGGTTVNGQPYIHLGNRPLDGVYVEAGAGNDWVELVNIHVPGTITMLGGDGNDAVVLYGVSAGTMTLDLGSGEDQFVTDGVWVNGVATLDGGPGTDSIDFRTYGIAAVTPRLTNTEKQT